MKLLTKISIVLSLTLTISQAFAATSLKISNLENTIAQLEYLSLYEDKIVLESNDLVYPNGDLYYLLGAKDDWGKKEWNYFYSFSKWAVARGFRTILIPRTTVAHARAAVQDDNTTVIIWSSHGASSGRIYDYESKPLPYDTFSKDRGERFVRLVLNNCYSSTSVQYYDVPQFTTSWKGLTNSGDMIDYLNSNRFDKSVLNALGKDSFL